MRSDNLEPLTKALEKYKDGTVWRMSGTRLKSNAQQEYMHSSLKLVVDMNAANTQCRPNVPLDLNVPINLVFWGLAGSCSELGLCGVLSLTQLVNFREMSYVGASSADMLCQLGGRSDRERCTTNVKKKYIYIYTVALPIYIYTTREGNLRCSCILVRIITCVGTIVV